MNDPRDFALQATVPTVMVPLFGEFQQLTVPGDRILIASNGVFLECSRKWGYFLRKIADALPVSLPYGQIGEATRLIAAKLPSELLQKFIQLAQVEANVEIGGSILWNENTNRYRLARSTSLHATGSYLKQELAPLNPGEHLVIDCHSHAHHPAFFSPIDDASDSDMTKFAFVVGDCNTTHPSVKLRLCIRGKFEDMDISSKLT